MNSPNQSQNTRWIFTLVLLFLLGALVYLLWQKYSVVPLNPPDQLACPREEKLCPDGKVYVGRVGPNCEFQQCPDVIDDNIPPQSNLTTTTNNVTFQYPPFLRATYIHTVDWPPQVQLVNTPFTCIEAGSETASAGQTQKVTINNHQYCLTKESEGAAGSTYTQYAVAFPKGNKTVIFTFSLRSVQCGNYPEAEKNICETERNTFDINPILDEMAQSVTL